MSEKGYNIEKLKNQIILNGHSLSRNSIGNIINERNSPKVDTLQIIADALGVEVSSLFSSESNENNQDNINGFIDYEGIIYRINSVDDIKTLYKKLSNDVGEEPEAESESEENVNFADDYLVRTLRDRGRSRTGGVVKLKSHIYKRYNVTVCNRRELEAPNDLLRETKIWVFRSREEEQKAKSMLKKMLNFNFNA